MSKLVVAFIVLLVACKPRPTSPPTAPHDAAADAIPYDASQADATLPPDGPTHVVGAFALTISTGKTSNCELSGADIGMMLLSLKDGAGNCIITTLHVKNVGDVKTRCNPSVPAPVQCLELSNTIISDTNLELGGYHLTVDGLIDGSTCWRGDASIGVVQGTPSEQQLVLLKLPVCTKSMSWRP